MDRGKEMGTPSLANVLRFCAALLVLAAAMLNWLCVALLPAAGILVFGYSYTKRFTWLCHWWLGLLECNCFHCAAELGCQS